MNSPALAAPRQGGRRNFWQDYSLPLGYAALFVVLALTVNGFFSAVNIVGLLLSVAQIGMVACTMMLCLASRDFDLSVGSTIAFTGVLGALLLQHTQSLVLAIGGGLLAGALIGALNGALIAYLRINALIATLATMLMVRGMAFIVSHGQSVGISDARFIDFGDAQFAGLPAPVLLAAGCSSSSACCSTTPCSGATRWPSAATPRRRGWLASRSSSCASGSSRCRASSRPWPA